MNVNVASRAVERRDDDAEDEASGDFRFRALLAPEDWINLPPAVRRRFTKRLAGGIAVYRGDVVTTHFSTAGWLLVQAARLIGGPFPLSDDVPAPSVVTVTDDKATGGQTWTRLYTRRNARPQVIHSSKRFAGTTGLEEHVGGGVGMALKLSVEGGALVFRSTQYFITLAGFRIPIPRWMCPGTLTVTHREVGGGKFSFALAVMHPRLGQLIQQTAIFREWQP